MTADGGDPWNAWLAWSRTVDDDVEKLYEVLGTVIKSCHELADLNVRLIARVATLESQLGIAPAAPPAEPGGPAPTAASAGPVDGAALIAKRQARAAARAAATDQSQHGAADFANAAAAIIARAQSGVGE
jgi:hypothetical protein